MLRRMLVLSTVAGGLASMGAMASPLSDTAPRADAAPGGRGALQLAQASDYELCFDGRGNRVIVDSYTGKVIAVQPPQARYDDRVLRREQRMRELDRARNDDRYYLDDPEDMARLRRRQMEERRGYGDPPADDYGSYDGGGSPDVFPEAPRDPYAAPGRQQPRDIQRQPTKEASIEPQPPRQATQPDAKAKVNPSLALGSRQDVAALQVLLDRAGASPGVIDGRFGSNVDKAL